MTGKLLYSVKILRPKADSDERKTFFVRAEAEYEKGNHIRIWEEWITPNWWLLMEVRAPTESIVDRMVDISGSQA